jgi:hypothetical protein
MTAAEDRDLTSNVKLRSEKIKIKEIFNLKKNLRNFGQDCTFILPELQFLKPVGEENVEALKKD